MAGRTTLAAACALASGCASVGPGHAGVLWRSVGGTQQRTWGEGRHAVFPWNYLYVYDLRTMSHDEILNVIASNGLEISLDTTIRYHLAPEEIVAMHKEIGPQFYDKVLAPLLRSDARRVFGRYTPEEIYSTKRDDIEREIRVGLETKLQGKHIVLEAVLIRNIQLPDAIRRAIDEKLEAEQEVLKMKYVLQVAQAKADEKKIEAGGIADYNKIVTKSLSPDILQFERIEELGRLAVSANSKTVIIGPEVGSKLMLTTHSETSDRTR